MRIVLTLLARDEIDIIRANLEYHIGQGVDRIIVTDNGSTDGTRELLGQYAARGVITLIDEPPSDFSQHRWVTRMARMACTDFGADWVVNGDADELFVWRQGGLHEALTRIPADTDSLLVARHDFVPFERPMQRSPQVEMIYRKTVSLNIFGKPLPPKVLHRAVPDVVIEQGNHGARSPRFRRQARLGEIEIFHYPIRSQAQFESKVRNAGSGYARNRDLAAAAGAHKRWWYDRLVGGELQAEFSARRFFDAGRLRAALASGEVVVDRVAAGRLEALGSFSAAAAPSDP